MYEHELALSLYCKEPAQWVGMSHISCAVLATAERVYNYGFVVQEETCLICRAAGTMADAEVLEIQISLPLYVEGGFHWS